LAAIENILAAIETFNEGEETLFALRDDVLIAIDILSDTLDKEKPMTDQVRWGVLGATARIAGSAVIPAIMASEHAHLAAVASRNLDSAQEVAAASGSPDVRAYGDYDSLIADPSVDVIYIPLPNNLHLEWAVEALNNGKHVLCEKPLAMNADEAAEMVETARANGVLLSEAFMYRYQPLMAEVFGRVRAGEIGKVSLVRASFSFIQNSTEDYRRDPSMGGGALLDVGCYCVHVARQAFGTEPLFATGTSMMDSETHVDMTTTAQMEFGESGMALVDCSFAMEFRASYEIVGDQGSFAVAKFFGTDRAEDVRYTLTKGGAPPEIKAVPPANMYQEEVDALSRRVRGEEVFLLPAEDGYHNMRALDAIAASARQGGKVSVGD